MTKYYPDRPVYCGNWYDNRPLIEAAKYGAVIGGTAAAAVQIQRYRQGETDWRSAAADTAKGALQASVAASTATAVGRLFCDKPALSLLATLATGTAVMYAINQNTRESGSE